MRLSAMMRTAHTLTHQIVISGPNRAQHMKSRLTHDPPRQQKRVFLQAR